MDVRGGGGEVEGRRCVCPTIHKDYREMLFTRLSTGPLADSTSYSAASGIGAFVVVGGCA